MTWDAKFSNSFMIQSFPSIVNGISGSNLNGRSAYVMPQKPSILFEKLSEFVILGRFPPLRGLSKISHAVSLLASGQLEFRLRSFLREKGYLDITNS